jgi:uncharacterized membrane protein YkvA (DUF1232 family)
VIPEETYGAVGYLDDLFLCAWSLKKLEDQMGYAVLEKNWEGDKELSDVIKVVYDKSLDRVWKAEKDILEYVGLVQNKARPPYSKFLDDSNPP